MNQTDKLAVTRGMPTAIRTLKDCESAVGWIRQAEAFIASVEESFKDNIQNAHKAHKAALKLKNDVLEDLPEQIEVARGMVKSYASEGCELPEGVSSRVTWKAKVVDPSMVPAQWCIPDQKLLDDFAKKTQGHIPIEGVEWVEVVSVAIKGEA